MTYIKYGNRLSTLKKLNALILFCAFLTTTSFTFSQITSVEVEVDFSQVTDSVLGELVDQMDIEIEVSGISAMGAMVLHVYDDSENVQATKSYTKAELISEGLISGDIITLEVLGLYAMDSHKIDCMVSTVTGANYPVVIIEYNPQ